MSSSEGFELLIAREQLGLALADENLRVLRRCGALSEWLPGVGEPVCASPLLLNMEEALCALRGAAPDLVMPSMRLPARHGARVTIAVVWDEASSAYVILTMPDHGGDQTDRLLASERREKLLLQQQAEAAAAQMRLSDALYRDLVESAGDLVLRFDAGRRVVFANRRVAELLAVTQNALVGRAIDALFPPRTGENPWRPEAYGDAPGSFELVSIGGDGAPRCIAWDVRSSGPVAGGEFQAVGRDITAAKRLEVEKDKAREEARAAALAAQRLAIAHDLHDTLARSIVALILEIGVIAKTTQDAASKAALQEAQDAARAGLAEAREAIVRLRAVPSGEDPGRIAEDFRASAQAQGIEVVANIAEGEEALPGAVAEAVSRIMREALRNIELHAGARRVVIALARDDGKLRLSIADDGVGFDPTRPTLRHFGLLGMRERAAQLGATLSIDSAPGKGTRLTLLAPIGAKESTIAN